MKHKIDEQEGESEEDFANSLKELSHAEDNAKKIVEKATAEREKILAEAVERQQEILEDARAKAVDEKNKVIEHSRQKVELQCEKILEEASEQAEQVKSNGAKRIREVSSKLLPIVLKV